jgi:exosortase/archaeosortase family protein
MGMVIIHFTNILRIVLLSLVSITNPEWWHIAHNTVLRGMFYVVILILWIIWVERVNKRP